MANSRGTCSLQMRCKFCSSQGSITLQPKLTGNAAKHVGDYTYRLDRDAGQWRTMAVVECRSGIEVTEWHLRDGFTVKCSESTMKFDDVDLSDEFADYDDQGNCAVSITELETQVVRN